MYFEGFPSYEDQVKKFREAFNPDEAMIIRVEDGILEIRVLFDGDAEDKNVHSS
jgi:hypothetical protein